MTRDAVPFPLHAAAVDPVIEPDSDGDDVPPRQCGRCRMMFDGDPTLDPLVRNEWALCPACEAIILPARAKHAKVIAFSRQAGSSGDGPAGER